VDAILLMANVPETVTLVRQMKENKFSVKSLQGWKGTCATEFWKALGKNAEISCVMGSGPWISHSREPRNWESVTKGGRFHPLHRGRNGRSQT
jgi:ABC-type branched-subunit amino acid transport system substrate-binding protein